MNLQGSGVLGATGGPVTGVESRGRGCPSLCPEAHLPLAGKQKLMSQPWGLSREPPRVKDLEKNGVNPPGPASGQDPHLSEVWGPQS